MSDIIDRSNRKLGQASITNSAGDRDVYIQGSLGDEETFVNALATTSFMLQRIPGTNTYKRFDGKVVPVDSSGTEIFTDSNPGSIKLTGSRTAVIAHRTAITSVDKVPAITITAADQPATAGSLTAVAHGIGVAPGNSYGSAGVSALVTVTPTVNKSIDITIPQATGAEYYDIYLSTSTTAPLWVARVTETQRATGCVITAVGTVEAGGSAGVVNVQTVGTGIASTSASIVANNAYVFSGIEEISCVGKTKAYIYIKSTVTDLRIAPSVGIVPFFSKNDTSNDWYAVESNLLSLLGGISGQPLSQVIVVDVNSVKNLIVLIDIIAGQGTVVNIDVELY